MIICLYRVLKYDITKNKFVKLWDLVSFWSRVSLNKGACQKLPFNCYSPQNVKDESLILPHINLSNFESVPNRRNWNKF